jgi:low affinity Fe/Cu permease
VLVGRPVLAVLVGRPPVFVVAVANVFSCAAREHAGVFSKIKK